MQKRPIFSSLLVFVFALALTQSLAFLQYSVQKGRQNAELTHELSAVKDRFSTVLNNDIACANALAIIYKEYGAPRDFDSIARQILESSKYVDGMGLSYRYVTTNVYPMETPQSIRYNILADPVRGKDAMKAVAKREIYFSGPFEMRTSPGKGIVGRLPIFVNDTFAGFSMVRTKLSTIGKVLALGDSATSRFIFQLSKVNPQTGQTEYFFTDHSPKDFEHAVAIEIPEGSWLLQVAYNPASPVRAYPLELCILGILFSFLVGLVVYTRAKEPYRLKKIIEKEREKRLKTEDRLQATMDDMPIGCKIIGFDWKYLYINNEAAKQAFGTKEEILGKTIYEVHPGVETSNVYAMYRQCMEERKRKIFEEQYTYSNGITCWYDLRVEPVEEGIFIVTTDVTEKRRAVESISRYNRELTLLNKINDIILQTTTEAELFEKVCKYIVIGGQYKLAWMCYEQGADEQFVKVQYAAGATGYIAGVPISTTDEALSKGPTARVLLEGKPVIISSLKASEFFAPWLEKAQQFGISSSLVLPLFIEGQKGAISIYSERIGAFEDHEFDVLQRIAANVSLAAKNIRNRDAKGKMSHLLGERVKELSTIYQTNKILQDTEQSIEQVFTAIADIIPPGWQYPEVCAARIVFEGNEYKTANYQPSAYAQQAKIELQDGRKGFVEVVYTAQKDDEFEGPFFKEERDLLNAISETIMVYFNKKANQDALVTSETNFRSAFEYAAVGMALTSMDGGFLRVNKELCNILGYTKEELLSKTFYEVTHQKDRGKDIAFVKETLEGTKDFYRVDKRYLHKNGSTVWVNLNSSVVRAPSGKPLYFVSQIKDVTESLETQLKFRNLVEKSLVGVYILQDGKFAYVNPRIIEESGYTEEELTTRPIEDFVYKGDLDKVQDNIKARLKGTVEVARYEVRAVAKDGKIMWMEMFGTAMLYRGAPAIIGTMVNITEKKEVYSEHEKTLANLQSIFDNTNVAYLLIDEQFRIAAYNQFFLNDYAKLTGITLSIGTHLVEATLPEKRDNLLRILEQVIATSKAIEYEAVFPYNEELKYFTVTMSPVLSSGKLIGFCMAAFDNTNRKNLEIERQNMITDLIQRNRDLEQFAYILSHNVRGPLSTMLGLHALLKEEVYDKSVDYIVDGIGVTAEKLDTVIKDLNEILHSRRDVSEQRQQINLYDIVQNVKDSMSGVIANSNAGINCDFINVHEVSAIRSYMLSIFYNLILNAIKFAKPGVEPRISILSENIAGNVNIYFTDNGIGIDVERYSDRIFGLYQRFHPQIEGKGLGLFTVKTQVEMMHGKIEVVSVPGAGTTFKIVLRE